MKNLADIFLLSSPQDTDLDIAVESIQDGNSNAAHFHLLSLMHKELSELNNEILPQSFLRFSSLSNTVGYEALKEDIKLGRLTLSNPFKFNDPMDPILRVWIEKQKRESWQAKEKKYFKAVLRALKNLRICCLTESNFQNRTLPLMWSHYADSHKGIAIKYKITDDVFEKYNDDSHLLRLCKVAYRDRKVLCNYITLDNALLAKGSCWEYEWEHRLLYFSLDDREFQDQKAEGKNKGKDFITLDGFKIEAIFLGVRIDPKKEHEICEIANQRNIPIYKMKYSDVEITDLEVIPKQ